MKKNILFLQRTLVVAVFLLMTVMASAFDDGRFSYTITKRATDTESGTVTLNKKSGEVYSGFIVIPSVATDGEHWYDVTAIGANTFQNCDGITQVNMEVLKLESIGAYAFAGCVSLKEILIPGCKYVAQGAFSGCVGLEKVTLGYGVEYLGADNYNSGVFQGCTSLKEVEIIAALVRVSHYAFKGCTSLESITLNASLQSMGDYVFQDCSALQTFTIPNAVKDIGNECFVGCSSLTQATIGASVTTMGSGLFQNCKKLEKVTIQSGCELISSNCFSGCVALKEISIPGSVKWIQQTAFAGCTALETVTMGQGVLYIGTSNYNTGVFQGCTALKNVTIPNTVINIHHYAFKNCSSLESITLNEGLQYMGDYVFVNCSSLKSIAIPNTVETIGNECFTGCSSLTKASIGAKVSKMGSQMFQNCTKLAEVTIAEGCSVLASSTFQGCLALKEIVIPGTIEWVQQTAFAGCTSLESVTMGEGVLYIGTSNYNTGVFQGCTQLWKVEIPSTIKKIHHYAFKDCPNLRRFTCAATTIPDMGTYIWANSAQPKATLYVPESALADYQASTQWNGFKNIWPIGKTGGEDIYGECDLHDVPSNSAYFDAAAFLCDRTVLSGSKVNGLVAVDDDITRAQLAKVAFRGLYLLDGIEYPAYLASDYFPTVYQDINTLTADNEYYYQAARALLYLDYGDGVTPFDRNRLNFNPSGEIERIHVLKVLMETFDIQPDVANTNNPFPNEEDCQHLLKNQPRKFGYIRKAAKLGIIDTGSGEFRPYAKCKRGEAFLMLYRIMQKIEAGNITKPVPTEQAYFEPLNMTLKTLALGLDVQMGNFNHYTKSSFSIDGVVPLTFAHTYNSYHTAIDDVFFGQRRLENVDVTYRPLTAGWSHTYDCYVTIVNSGDGERAIIHWGSGSIHVYKKSGTGYKAESLGVYDQLTISDGVATVKTKGQVTYKFEQLEGTGTTIYYMTSVTDRNDNRLTVNYVDGERGMKVVSSVTDGARQLNFTDQSGTNLLASVSDPLNRVIKFTYSYNKTTDEYTLTKFTDAKNQVTTYTYGDQSRLSTARLLTRIQLPKGNYIENEYDQNRRLQQSITAYNNSPVTKTSVSVLADYKDGGVATNSTVSVERESVTSSMHYEMNRFNAATHVTGEEGLERFITYGNEDDEESGLQHLPTRVESNQTTIDDIKYDSRGNVTSITVQGNDGSGVLTRKMTYDSMNNLTSITDAKGNKTTYSYDSRGNLTKVSAPEGVTSSFTVDSRGLTTKAVNPMGIETEYTYNGFGNLTSATLPALSLTSNVEYDAASRATSVYDALNRKTSFTYDNNDNLLKETDPLNNTTQYAYDKNDNLTKVTNAAGRYTTMTYDNVTDWLTSVAFGGSTKSYEYNKDGTLKTYVKPDGTRLDCSYDKLGRVTFDGVNRYKYDDKMNLESVQSDKNKLTFFYDGFNRPTMVDFEQGSEQNTIRYAYDNNSNVTAITYADDHDVKYEYDALNRLTAMTDWKGNTISYTYRLDSKLSRVDYPNGMYTEYHYDAAGRLVGKDTKVPGVTVVVGDANGDGEANITDVTTILDYIMDRPSTAFDFDAADVNGDKEVNITDVTGVLDIIMGKTAKTAPEMVATVRRALKEHGYKDLATYEYILDNVGNIIEQEAIEPFKATYEAAANTSYSYNNANRITSAGDVNFSFDMNGNTTARITPNGREEYTWNQQDRLVYADGTTIVYDPLGLIRSYGDTHYTVSVIGNGDVLSDSKTGNSYLYGNGLEARIDQQGNVSYYVTDMRGSVIAIVDMDGNVTHRYQYDDFGRVIQCEEKDFNPFRYIGKYGVMYNTDTHYYMRARHYDPTIGRFLSEDPIWSTNLYPYADNNPIMGIDPEGLSPTYSEALALADDAYNIHTMCSVVKGWGLVKDLSYKNSGFKASIYQKGNEYVLAFAGTTFSSGADWKNNLQQGLGLESTQYDLALLWGLIMQIKHGTENVTFVGHSLGGGLASAASRATGCYAITFNAAALSSTYNKGKDSKIDAYIVKGEELDLFQKGIFQHAEGTRHYLDSNCSYGHHRIGCFPKTLD